MRRNIPVPVIVTDSFTLRPFCHSDAESLQKHINNPKVAKRVTNIPFPYTLEHAHVWINSMESWISKSSTRVDFVIDINGEVVGSVAFINLELHKAQLSYWLAEDYWGKGIVPEAIKELVSFGFKELKLARIYGHVFPPNKASQRVLEKVGFEREAVIEKEWYRDGKLFDSYLYKKINPEYGGGE